jgi:hypothetical protein
MPPHTEAANPKSTVVPVVAPVRLALHDRIVSERHLC